MISVHDASNKTLSSDSNYIVDVVMCTNIRDSSFSMRDVIITLIL